MPVRTSSLLRGLGAALAVLTTNRLLTAVVTGVTYGASRVLDPDGTQLVSFSFDDDDRARYPDWFVTAAPEASSVTSWVTMNELFAPLVRRLPVPRIVGAVAYGAAICVLDDRVATMARKAIEAAEQRAAEATPAADASVPPSDGVEPSAGSTASGRHARPEPTGGDEPTH